MTVAGRLTYPSILRASSVVIISVIGSTGEARMPCFS
jgi:hypothetical protein